MRLSKRFATVALAAVMAVSMLTACGGDAPASSGNSGNNASGGNTSTSTPAKPDSSNSGSTSGGSEENGTEQKLPTTWNASKTKALFNSKGIADTNVYVDGTWSIVDAKTSEIKSSAEIVYAVKGRKTYMKMVDNSGTIRLYKNEAGDYFVQNGNTWYECTDSTDIQSAKLILAVQQIQYKVPTNVYNFRAMEANGYYYEGFSSNWTNGSKVDYTYGYTSDGKLYGIMIKVDNTTGYVTCPVTLAANPSDDFFPNVVS